MSQVIDSMLDFGDEISTLWVFEHQPNHLMLQKWPDVEVRQLADTPSCHAGLDHGRPAIAPRTPFDPVDDLYTSDPEMPCAALSFDAIMGRQAQCFRISYK